MRLIDADAIPYQNEIIADESGYMAEFDIAYKGEIDRQPTVDVAEVVQSHWDYDCGVHRCHNCGVNPEEFFHTEGYDSVCMNLGNRAPRFCPNCGANMREEEKEA